MKRIFLIMSLLSLSVMGFAQEDKATLDKAVSPELSALQTAASLAKYGYANYSSTALIEAAKIFAETKAQEGAVVKTSQNTQTGEIKESAVSFKPAQLLADAKKFAGKDKVVLAYANQVEKSLKSSSTRGAVGGPRYAEDVVYGKDVNTYTVKFWANELAQVGVSGNGNTDLDLYVYDANGNLIGSDSDYSDDCLVRWVPAWSGTFTIKVVNRGIYNNAFVILTN